MEEPYRHNPDATLSRRNRALHRTQKRRLDGRKDRLKSRYFNEVDNIVDEGFSETLANRGTNAGKHVRVGIAFDKNGRVIR